MKYLEEGTASFNWTVAWRTENFEEDRIKWQHASSEAQLENTLQLVKDWPPEVARGIAQSKASNILTPLPPPPPNTLLETVLPAQGLPGGRVTLIGDATHSMVPFRGMGANTALLDSYNLGKALIDGIKANEEFEWVLKCYQDVMVPRGLQKVLESRATGEGAASEELAGGRLS